MFKSAPLKLNIPTRPNEQFKKPRISSSNIANNNTQIAQSPFNNPIQPKQQPRPSGNLFNKSQTPLFHSDSSVSPSPALSDKLSRLDGRVTDVGDDSPIPPRSQKSSIVPSTSQLDDVVENDDRVRSKNYVGDDGIMETQQTVLDNSQQRDLSKETSNVGNDDDVDSNKRNSRTPSSADVDRSKELNDEFEEIPSSNSKTPSSSSSNRKRSAPTPKNNDSYKKRKSESNNQNDKNRKSTNTQQEVRQQRQQEKEERQQEEEERKQQEKKEQQKQRRKERQQQRRQEEQESDEETHASSQNTKAIEIRSLLPITTQYSTQMTEQSDRKRWAAAEKEIKKCREVVNEIDVIWEIVAEEIEIEIEKAGSKTLKHDLTHLYNILEIEFVNKIQAYEHIHGLLGRIKNARNIQSDLRGQMLKTQNTRAQIARQMRQVEFDYNEMKKAREERCDLGKWLNNMEGVRSQWLDNANVDDNNPRNDEINFEAQLHTLLPFFSITEGLQSKLNDVNESVNKALATM